MATGTYPSEHGSTNNTFFRTGDTFTNRTSFSARGRAPGRHDRERRRTRRQEGRADRLGRRRSREHRRPDGRLHQRSSPTAACSSAPLNAVEQAGSAFFGVTYQVAAGRPARRAGPASRPATRRRRRSRRRGRSTSTLRRAESEPHLQRLLLRQRRQRRRRQVRPRDRQPGRQDRRQPVDRPQGRRLQADQADGRQRPHRRARRPDGRPLHQADLALAPTRRQFKLYDTSLARAIAKCGDAVRRPAGRRRRRGPAREVHRGQPAAVGGGRLRAARGRRRRRGHLRRAGPRSRAGLQPRR